MNKKVFVSMLVLSIVFLVGMYVLKIFYPQEFVLAVQNQQIIDIGNFIDNNRFLYYVFCGITAFITYYLYCCACSHKIRLKWIECLYIVITIIIVRLTGLYISTTLNTILSAISFVILPSLMKSDLKTTAIAYSVHSIAQGLSLGIRNLPLFLATTNTTIILILSLDVYLWLILMYIIFNYKGDK